MLNVIKRVLSVLVASVVGMLVLAIAVMVVENTGSLLVLDGGVIRLAMMLVMSTALASIMVGGLLEIDRSLAVVPVNTRIPSRVWTAEDDAVWIAGNELVETGTSTVWEGTTLSTEDYNKDEYTIVTSLAYNYSWDYSTDAQRFEQVDRTRKILTEMLANQIKG